MAFASELPAPRLVFFDASGNPLSGGFVHTYIPGTTTIKTTWQDQAEAIPNANPVILDAAGSALIFGSGGYDIATTDSLGNAVPAYSGTVQAPGFISDIMLPVVGAASLAAAETALGISTAMQPIVASTTTAIARNLLGVASIVTPLQFGGIGDGSTDDTAAIQSALNSLTAGGTCYLPDGTKWKTASITIPVGVTLQGPYPSGIGAPGAANFTPPWGALSSLRLTAGSTITVNGGGGVSGLFIAPFGMTFQQSVSTGWVGTALTMNSADDIVIEKCQIMGFALGISAILCSRLRFRHLNMDNIAGIAISGATDVCYLDHIHMWPWATIAGGGVGGLVRSGTGIAMANGNDDSKIRDCFTYGYAIGFELNAMINVTVIGCNCDSTNVGVGIGFNIIGPSYANLLLGCQASGLAIGFNMTTIVNSNIQNMMAECVAFSCTSHGILVDTLALGDVSIRGGYIYACGHAITVSSAVSRVYMGGIAFEANTLHVVINVTTSNVTIGPGMNFGNLAAGTFPVSGPSVISFIATAANLLLPVNGDFFSLTGTTGFGSVSGGYFGRMVTLIFAGVTTVTSAFTGSTTDMRLAGNVAFVTAIGSTLTLRHNGTQWFEIGRSA